MPRKDYPVSEGREGLASRVAGNTNLEQEQLSTHAWVREVLPMCAQALQPLGEKNRAYLF